MTLSDHRSKKLRKGLAAVQGISDETQAVLTQLEDALTVAEDREARRSARTANGHLTDKYAVFQGRS